MTPEDAARLTEICFPEGPWSAEEIRAYLALPTTRFFFRDDAFLLSQIVAPEAEILLLAVAPDVRRQGVATRLLDWFIATSETDGVTDFHLEVSAENPAAIALYSRAGFAVAGRRKGYYLRSDGSRTDAVLMARRSGGP